MGRKIAHHRDKKKGGKKRSVLWKHHKCRGNHFVGSVFDGTSKVVSSMKCHLMIDSSYRLFCKKETQL